MLIKTILNKCHKFKSFVYQQVKLASYQGTEVIDVTIIPRKNALALCSCCGQPAPGYDSLSERRFEFMPLWGYRVFFLYTLRRVACRRCGVKVEQVPWAQGKKELTTTYMQYLAFWAEKLSWQEVARVFQTSWEKVFFVRRIQRRLGLSPSLIGEYLGHWC
jgi:transposase